MGSSNDSQATFLINQTNNALTSPAVALGQAMREVLRMADFTHQYRARSYWRYCHRQLMRLAHRKRRKQIAFVQPDWDAMSRILSHTCSIARAVQGDL